MEHDEQLREEQRLEQTVAVIDRQLDAAAAEGERQAGLLRALQEERMEENRMDIGGMGTSQGFDDLLELSQGMMEVHLLEGARAEGEQTLRRLVRMRDKPYFARIDFRPDGGDTRQVYIGRATLMEAETMRIHVYDWRVPIASVFYQYGVGPSGYDAPAGTIEGETLLKRQYEIQRGTLRYYFDADEEVRDSFLRELLSQPAAPQMKGIVETIQRDQDRIIRDMQADLLMVQGAAGSGKTSVALHRVAYLMYQGLQKRQLSAGDILIIAPNATFERYIAGVLPELGEKQVRTMLAEELLGDLLPDAQIEPRAAWVERTLTEPDAACRAGMRRARDLKGSRAYVALLDRLVHDLPRRWIPFADVDYDGRRVAQADQLRVAICNSIKKVPLGIQLRMLEKDIWRRIHDLRPARLEALLAFARRFPNHAMEASAFARMLSIRESGRLHAQIRAFTQVDCAALYRALFADKTAFARLADGLLPPDSIEPLRRATLAGLSGDALPYEDAAAIAYLEARVNGCRAYAGMRQVVVDEAQDLDTLHGALLGLLFPNARFTLLGDVHQALAGAPNPALYEDLEAALHRKNSLLVRLDKSFRCTREIWAFSARFLPPGEAGTCFSRSGEAPTIHRADSEAAQDALVLAHACACIDAGHRTVALLCRTQAHAQTIYDRLRGETDVALIGPDDAIRPGRVSIVPLYLAKGLEFDAVLLCDVDAAHYPGEEDRGLLYVACTRALHVLRLFYAGERSPLLAGMEDTP